MAVVDESIVIKRSPAEVYDYVIDLTNQPKWETTVVSASPRDGQSKVHEGSEVDYVLRVGAMKLNGVSVITGIDSGHTGAYTLTSKLGTVRGSYTVDEHPQGALFTHHAVSEPANALQRVVDPIAAKMFQRQVRQGLQKLRQQLESGSSS